MKELVEIRRYSVISLLLLLTLIIASCVQSSALSLKEVSADIVTMEDSVRIGDDGKEGVFFDTTELRYRFVLENTGRRPIGSSEKPILAVLEHGSDLIYEVALMRGHGYAGITVIPAGEMGDIEISYNLGVNDDPKRVSDSLPLPEPEILDEIEDTAWDATLIIFEWRSDVAWDQGKYMRDGSLPESARKLMRFDLREYKE